MTEFTALWGSWFAGYATSNGHFSIDRGNGDNPHNNYRCKFELRCHPVDNPILTEVRDVLELGSIIDEPITIEGNHTGRFQTRMQVDIIEECAKIVEIFTTYPLRTYQQDAFGLWERAVAENMKPINERDPLMLSYYCTEIEQANLSRSQPTQQKEKQSAPKPAEKPHAKKTSFRLYEITDVILNQFTDKDDDDFDIGELEKWEAAFEHKVESCAAVVKNLTAEADACQEEARRLSQKATVISNRIDALKGYMKRNMEYLDKKSVTAGIFKVRIQKSPMSVKIIDEDSVPEKYKWEFKETRFRKKSIADHVKATGEIPPGVNIPTKTHLRIT